MAALGLNCPVVAGNAGGDIGRHAFVFAKSMGAIGRESGIIDQSQCRRVLGSTALRLSDSGDGHIWRDGRVDDDLAADQDAGAFDVLLGGHRRRDAILVSQRRRHLRAVVFAAGLSGDVSSCAAQGNPAGTETAALVQAIAANVAGSCARQLLRTRPPREARKRWPPASSVAPSCAKQRATVGLGAFVRDALTRGYLMRAYASSLG